MSAEYLGKNSLAFLPKGRNASLCPSPIRMCAACKTLCSTATASRASLISHAPTEHCPIFLRKEPYISAKRALYFFKGAPCPSLWYVRNTLDVVIYGDRKSRESHVTYTRTKEPYITAERVPYFHKKSPVFSTHAYVRAACFDVVFYGDRESRESHVTHTHTQKPSVSANRALCFRKKMPVSLTHLYVRSMLDVVFYGDRESRDKFNIVLSEMINPKMNAELYLDSAEHER